MSREERNTVSKLRSLRMAVAQTMRCPKPLVQGSYFFSQSLVALLWPGGQQLSLPHSLIFCVGKRAQDRTVRFPCQVLVPNISAAQLPQSLLMQSRVLKWHTQPWNNPSAIGRQVSKCFTPPNAPPANSSRTPTSGKHYETML